VLFKLRGETWLGFSKVKRGAWRDIVCQAPVSIERSCLHPGEGRRQSSLGVTQQEEGMSDSILRAVRSEGF